MKMSKYNEKKEKIGLKNQHVFTQGKMSNLYLLYIKDLII